MGVDRVVGYDTLYSKEVSPGGRVRYRKVAQYVAFDALPEGAWLVITKPGQRVITRMVTPDYPGAIAAIVEAREAMIDALVEASRAVPRTRKTDEIEREAYRAYADVMRKHGREPGAILFERKSAVEIVEAAIKALKERMAKEKNDDERD